MTKVEVYEAARHRGLAVDVQSERQDLCFLADHDYRRFLVERVPEFFRSGPVRDARGYVLGKHRGLPTYTIGQRYDTAAAESLYVLDIVTRTNTLIVGTREELGRTMCLVGPMHYVGDRVPGRSFRANAQFRSRAQPTTATVTPLSDERARVDFDVPQHDVTPGQFLVLSNGEEIIGGGVILPRH
jgi:tRNA-specific 2-thiouridylase